MKIFSFVLSILLFTVTSCTLEDTDNTAKPTPLFKYKINNKTFDLNDYSAVYLPKISRFTISTYSNKLIYKDTTSTDDSFIKRNTVLFTSKLSDGKHLLNAVDAGEIIDSMFFGPNEMLINQSTLLLDPDDISENQSYFYIQNFDIEDKLISGYCKIIYKPNITKDSIISYEFKNLPFTISE
jgi:hypothetical protein